jgi:predicted NAD-dependent protein-ADP-ribosyltransferase YbiA (DUF1768 family)
MTESVNFYSPDKENGWFCNLWGGKSSKDLKDLKGSAHLTELKVGTAKDGLPNQPWKTVEHAFQAHKFIGLTRLQHETEEEFRQYVAKGREYAKIISRASTGASVARLGNIGRPPKRGQLKWYKPGHGSTHKLLACYEAKEDSENPTLNEIVLSFIEADAGGVKLDKSKLVGKLSVRVRHDWDSVKLQVMYDLLKVKFSNPELKERLLKTGDLPIHEISNDAFWGFDPEKGTGEDYLGKLLMELRCEFGNI